MGGKMRVKHGAPVEITYKDRNMILERHTVPVELAESDMAVFSATHGGVSGMVNWNHLGKPLSGPPKVSIKVVNPSDELKEGELCPCGNC